MRCVQIPGYFMLQAFQKFKMGFIMPPDDFVQDVLAYFTPVTFCRKFNCIFKANLCSSTLGRLLSFACTTSKTNNPPKLSKFLSKLSLSSASLLSFLLAPCFVLTFYFGTKKLAAYFYIFWESQGPCLVPLGWISFSTHLSCFFFFIYIYRESSLHIVDPVLLALAFSVGKAYYSLVSILHW